MTIKFILAIDYMEPGFNPLTLVFVAFALSVHGVFLFDRDFLFDKRKFKKLFVISLGLFVFCYILKAFGLRARNMEMMQVPFLALSIFFAMSYIFKEVFGENPEDSFGGMEVPAEHWIFNVLFWVIGLLVPIYLSLEIL